MLPARISPSFIAHIDMKTTIIFNIDKFLQNHPESTEYIAAWFKLVETGQWSSFEQMRQSFTSLEGKESNALFTIGCGRYTLKARINFKYKQIVVRHIIANADYDRQNL
ncbi:type II toxin-antitoxin system HigB family toxin [Moorena producens]|uniref:type II toxin-antitoxin system HigB family toxin n=1 Tax=Moorena producens TaxID=1155739 RepID=UPI001314A629|nr:type II toxin-antitoxin system HigB family toxin [Moorena producens]